MTLEERVKNLEKQKRRLNRCLGIVFVVTAALLGVAAATPEKLVVLVCNGFTVHRDEKEVATITDDGNAEFKGTVNAAKLTLGGKDVGAELVAVRTGLVAVRAELAALRAAKAAPPPPLAFAPPVTLTPTSTATPGLWSGKASSAGLVIVYTGGTGSCQELYIPVNGGSRIRTAPAHYTSLVCPIAAGETWEVRAYADDKEKNLNITSGDVIVSWMAVK